MSQSASIYRISKGYFQQLSEPDNKQHFDRDMAKDCSLFQGSFMALEFILSKAQDPAITKLASEIFNPSTSIANREMDELSSETQFESNQRGESIQFLDPDRISAIAAHLEKYSERDIRRLYDANELNREGIYPWCWQPGDWGESSVRSNPRKSRRRSRRRRRTSST